MKDRKFPLGFIRVTLISLVIMIVVLLMAVNPDFKAVLKKWGSTSQTHWILEENQTYLLCGHTLLKQRQFSSERLFKRAMGDRPPLPSFQTDQRFGRLIRKLPGLCRNCRQHQFLGIREGLIVVLRGIPTQPGPVAESTGIKVDQLPEAELQDLKVGIPFRDAKEKLQLIEGLSGLIAN